MGQVFAMCRRKHSDADAVDGGSSEIDAAVLAAAKFGRGGLVQKLEISFAAENLVNLGTISSPGAFVVFYELHGNTW